MLYMLIILQNRLQQFIVAWDNHLVALPYTCILRSLLSGAQNFSTQFFKILISNISSKHVFQALPTHPLLPQRGGLSYDMVAGLIPVPTEMFVDERYSEICADLLFIILYVYLILTMSFSWPQHRLRPRKPSLFAMAAEEAGAHTPRHNALPTRRGRRAASCACAARAYLRRRLHLQNNWVISSYSAYAT